ncbi:MAG: NADH-quinone oxidoreductase subunit NuoE [Planctomycetes bacterium]|jgi:NADH:ubiquinone oxidoreductase subunit E|nr:NADH-quinone oxidoreductase subunit NuoE [Planctomycetota bacterium]
MESPPKAFEVVERTVHAHHFDPTRLIAILQDVQKELGWLPEASLRRVALSLGLPLSRVFGIASFYKAFSLVPRGRHLVQCCTGTACHVRGGPRILSRLKSRLRVGEGETTPDGRFTLEVVRCLGCCSISPVVMVGSDVYGNVDEATLGKILDPYE